jgi:hypothetical protein
LVVSSAALVVSGAGVEGATAVVSELVVCFSPPPQAVKPSAATMRRASKAVLDLDINMVKRILVQEDRRKIYMSKPGYIYTVGI